MSGVVLATGSADSWPFAGQEVSGKTQLMRVVPHVQAEQSLDALEAAVSALRAELEAAQARLSRLEELLELQATSQREVEQATTLVKTLEARHKAAERDLVGRREARSATGRSSAGIGIEPTFDGQVAEVLVSPGSTVAAGEPLARVVRTDRVWVEVALIPEAAARLQESPLEGVVLQRPSGAPLEIEEGLKLISIAPEISQRTGTVAALVEVPPPGISLGAVTQVQLLLDRRHEGIVIPRSALVDDAGVAVVYLQLSGEEFLRQPVEVLASEGDRLLVSGLAVGQVLVGRGGNSMRRASLMANGEVEGHVH